MGSQPIQSSEQKDPRDFVQKGVVVEAMPNTLFKVELNDQSVIIAYLSGKMVFNRIKVLVGDTVEVLIDQYGGKARITKRM